MITRSKNFTIKETIETTVHRHENGQNASATLTFRSVNGSHQSSIHLTLEEATQLAEALTYIAATEQ